ncbi:MAG: tetratricopeptide (TPR) repeat protein [Saprospiraceae bacterium]
MLTLHFENKIKQNKMINYIKFSTILLGITVLTSCSENLNLSPITQKSATLFYSTEQEVEIGVNGAYAQLQSNGLYGLDIIGVGEISGEDSFEEIAANDGGRFGQLDDFSTNAGNDLVGDIWRESYEGIQRTNIVLNRIQEVDYENIEVKINRIGEMKFLRALLYFNLVRLFGDVPLVIQETTNPSEYFGQGRSAASEVYAQIELDLEQAIEELPIVKVAGRPAKGAAQALLADVLMNQGQYAESIPYFMNIVNSNKYILVESTADLFGTQNEGNDEILFEVQFASGVDGNNEGSPAAAQFRPSGTTANAKGHNLPYSQFVTLYADEDTRKSDYVGLDANANPFYFSTKYEVSQTGPSDSGSDYYVIRYADVLLKYAEALAETGRVSEAAILLDQVRNRAGLANTDASNETQIKNAIALERRFEFIGEGHRWFDLKRTNNAITVMNAWFAAQGTGILLNGTNLLLPIPQSQIDTDPEIKQNTGY